MTQDNKFIRSLLENVKKGNNSSFEQLYQIYAGRVFTLSFRLLGNINLAEEATKEIFITARKQISSIRKDLSFNSWLVGITVYTDLEKLRNNGNSKKSGDNFFKAKNDKKNYLLSDLDKGILTLPEKERLVFVLKEIENYSEEEIADLLLTKLKDVKDCIITTHNKFENLKNLIQLTNLLDNKNESSANDVVPGNEIWKNIYSEIDKARLKESENLDNEGMALINKSETKANNNKTEKKFGLFSWKKR